MRGVDDKIATACSGADRDFFAASARVRKPSLVDFTPGVPDSMKSCASKCDRVASGLPTACTNASDLSLKYGTTEASDGCVPKNPSRSRTDSRATAIVGRAV